MEIHIFNFNFNLLLVGGQLLAHLTASMASKRSITEEVQPQDIDGADLHAKKGKPPIYKYLL